MTRKAAIGWRATRGLSEKELGVCWFWAAVDMICLLSRSAVPDRRALGSGTAIRSSGGSAIAPSAGTRRWQPLATDASASGRGFQRHPLRPVSEPASGGGDEHERHRYARYRHGAVQLHTERVLHP